MFFILSLPRSRTAWLSSFLTDDTGICSHEGIAYSDYPEGLEGDSTTAYPWIKEHIKKDDPIIIIHRDLDECLLSLEKAVDKKIDRRVLTFLEDEMDTIKNALHIRYEDINERLEDIWYYCGKSKLFDEERANKMIKMNIQNYEMIDEFKGMF